MKNSRDLTAGVPGADVIVLLHGMGTGASAWQPQIEMLSATYHVTAPYLPGYGPTPGPFSMSVARAKVASVIRKTSKSPVHLCGLSLGALVALEVAHHYPELVRSLVLSAGYVSLSAEREAQNRAVAATIRAYDPEKFRQEVLPGLVSGVNEAHREVALAEIGSLTPADLAELLAFEFDARPWLAGIEARALVLCGANDTANLPLSQELAAELPNATFQIIENAGHVANLDAPHEFTAAMLNFFGHRNGN